MLVKSDGFHGAQATPQYERVSPSKLALVVFGSALGLCAGFAPVYFGTISIFLKPIALEFGWGRAQTSGAAVFSMLGLAVGAVIVGRLMDGFGAKRTIIASVLATALLIGLLSTIGNSPTLFTALSFAIGVAGAGTTPPGYLSVLTQWFEERLGLALGIAGVGMGTGTILMPVIANSLISSQGWRHAYISLSVLSGLIGALACFLLFFKDDRGVRSSTQRMSSMGGASGLTVKEALKVRHLWLLLAVVTTVAVASLGVSIHFVPMLTDKGISSEWAAKAAAISGAGVVIGRVACGYLLDRYHAPVIAAGAFLLAAIGASALAMGQDTHFLSLAFSGLFIGFALGAEGDFLPYFVRRYFGLKAFSSVYGILFFAHGVGGVVGPILFGLSFDRLHTYSVALWGAVVALLMASVLIIFMGKYRYPRK